MSDFSLSQRIEAILVERNPRGMAELRGVLEPGYYQRAATLLRDMGGTVLIGTGFPKLDSFETDGPLGAIILYNCLEAQGARPVIACGAPLAEKLRDDYRVFELAVGNPAEAPEEARRGLDSLQPEVVISIERAGLARNGRFHNMRGEDITAHCACFDYFMNYADCPTIGIGDGGNEVGMGNVLEALAPLDIVPSVTCCDELLIADVSNWAVYGLLALLGHWRGEDLLANANPAAVLDYLLERGALDGVTLTPTPTEDGLPLSEGDAVIASLREAAAKA